MVIRAIPVHLQGRRALATTWGFSPGMGVKPRSDYTRGATKDHAVFAPSSRVFPAIVSGYDGRLFQPDATRDPRLMVGCGPFQHTAEKVHIFFHGTVFPAQLVNPPHGMNYGRVIPAPELATDLRQ